MKASSHSVIAPCFEVPLPSGRFDALAFHLREDLGMREVGVVGTTLEAKNSLMGFVVRLSELVIVRRAEGPCLTPVGQDLNHLGLQHADLQAEPGSRHIV